MIVDLASIAGLALVGVSVLVALARSYRRSRAVQREIDQWRGR